MASSKPPPADAAAGRRRHSRLRVHLPARLITLGGTLPATLLNLSFRGAKVFLGSAQTRSGANAVLSWGAFEAFCTVAWARDGHCGLDFDEPLKPHMLIETRDLADVTPRIDASRVAARNWAAGLVNR
jgi:PilZ domain